jgi:tripartite-type tricarboxylate transporter receptor subunit TctC
MQKIIKFIAVAFLFLFLAACSSEETQSEKGDSGKEAKESGSSYPEKPVTFYVQYSAGGATDLAYRQFFSVAEKYLGESIVVENVTGGGGTVGLSELAKREPDGYILGNTSLQPLTITPHNQTVAYTADDFSYIGGWGKYLYGIAVKADSPYADYSEFLEASQKNPGMAYSDSGPGGITTLGMMMLDQAEDNVPSWKSIGFDGGGEAMSSLLGGHTDFGINNPGAYKSALENGDLRLLLSLSDTRWDLAPDTPTAREVGYDFDITSWLAIGGPKGLPDEVIEVWSDVIQKTIEDPEFIEAAEKMDLPLGWMPGDEYEATVNEMYGVYGDLIKQLNQ